MLRVVRHDDAEAFLDRAESWLLEREAENNIVLSVAYLLRGGEKPFRQPAYLATIECDRQILGCALRAPPDGAYITDVPLDVIPTIAAQLRDLFTEIPDVAGPESLATRFARVWGGNDWVLHSRLQRYVLETVVWPAKAARGYLRHADDGERALLDTWGAAYETEVGSTVDVARFFRTMLERKALYLWDDEGPRCVVTASGVTPNGSRISSVYTPVEFRGHGYATIAVASVSQTILDGGKRFCTIAADIDNPVPNAIYRKIGYRPIAKFALILFTRA